MSAIHIIGDNLALNEVLRSVESFSAHFSCRICMMKNVNFKKSLVEDKKLLRTKQNYDVDLETNDVSKTGLKEKCIFHEIERFHVCENQSLNIMHDVFEGSGNYAMTSILYRLIFFDKLLTYEIVTSRMETFQYGLLESSNKPPPMTLEHIKDKNMLKMSAAEMTCFILYFGLIVGDLIPEGNEVWKFYLKLRQIVDVVTAPKLLHDHSNVLNDLVKNYNPLYIEFVRPLTIKSHNMTHYERLMLRNGSLIHCWSMRCESRNRDVQAIGSATCCTKNLLYTIAVKDQLMMAHTIMYADFNNQIKFGHIKRRDCSNSAQYFENISEDEIVHYTHITSNGQKCQQGTVILC